MGIKAPPPHTLSTLLSCFEGEHLERVHTSQLAPSFPRGWLEDLVHMDTPTIMGWIVGGRVYWNPSTLNTIFSVIRYQMALW